MIDTLTPAKRTSILLELLDKYDSFLYPDKVKQYFEIIGLDGKPHIKVYETRLGMYAKDMVEKMYELLKVDREIYYNQPEHQYSKDVMTLIKHVNNQHI